MIVDDNSLTQFIDKINDIRIWGSYEVKACLLRGRATDSWKIGAIRIQLLDYEKVSDEILYDHPCLKLIRRVEEITTLHTFLRQIIEEESFVFFGNEVSLEFVSANLQFDFHDRQYMINNYSIDNACYLLERGDSSLSHANFTQIDKELRQQLPRHSQPKESLTEACRSIIGVDLGGAHRPHIDIFAPIFLKIKLSRSRKEEYLFIFFAINVYKKMK